jgi:hypothetical protein
MNESGSGKALHAWVGITVASRDDVDPTGFRHFGNNSGT